MSIRCTLKRSPHRGHFVFIFRCVACRRTCRGGIRVSSRPVLGASVLDQFPAPHEHGLPAASLVRKLAALLDHVGRQLVVAVVLRKEGRGKTGVRNKAVRISVASTRIPETNISSQFGFAWLQLLHLMKLGQLAKR